ncbi:hypothetical protein BH10BAC1_BH10BAC1_12870 [soil metagenome]
MKKIFITLGILITIIIIKPTFVSAQMMGNLTNTSVQDTQTIQDEQAGKVIFDKLQSKQTSCANLSNDDFDVLGDYYMAQTLGNSHSAMNTMMKQRMGEENEKLMHIALGKRLSGCDTNALFPSQGASFLPMMGMMGGLSSPTNYYQPNNNSMMGNYYGNGMMGGFYGGFGGIFMIFWWILIIAGIVIFVKWTMKRSKGSSNNNESNSLEILKNRYAKGEINKEEFEEKKKDLSK